MATVGVVGLGAMGQPMTANFIEAGFKVSAFDLNKEAVAKAVEKGATAIDSPKAAAETCEFVVSMVPNDAILNSVVSNPETGLLAGVSEGKKFVHISCSTVGPDTSRALAKIHKEAGCGFVGAPVFARADGMARREATLTVGGAAEDVERAMPILEATSKGVHVFGEDAGAGNVAKLCGNFMIASAIETCAESMALAEKNGIDREKLMGMFSSTIFDCLIYKGYGGRVAARQHTVGQPMVGPGFQLELGHKDIALTLDTARKSDCPMPFGSVLQDRLLKCKANGMGQKDWSALAMAVSADAGITAPESDAPVAK